MTMKYRVIYYHYMIGYTYIMKILLDNTVNFIEVLKMLHGILIKKKFLKKTQKKMDLKKFQIKNLKFQKKLKNILQVVAFYLPCVVQQTHLILH